MSAEGISDIKNAHDHKAMSALFFGFPTTDNAGNYFGHMPFRIIMAMIA
jgi:hypothetical protein